jgi:hypothetical protein
LIFTLSWKPSKAIRRAENKNPATFLVRLRDRLRNSLGGLPRARRCRVTGSQKKRRKLNKELPGNSNFLKVKRLEKRGKKQGNLRAGRSLSKFD